MTKSSLGEAILRRPVLVPAAIYLCTVLLSKGPVVNDMHLGVTD